jgi:hypothetical protein
MAGETERNGHSGSEYGEITNPVALGKRTQKPSWWGSENAGGLVVIDCGSLELDATARIEAKGAGCASGGSINIKLKAGGAVLGSGVLDVGVTSHTANQQRFAGGGRVAVLDYGSITSGILENVVLDGQSRHGSGAGTLFHRKKGEVGNVVVRSSFTPHPRTLVDGPASLVKLNVDNTKVVYEVPENSGTLSVTTLVQSKSSSLKTMASLVSVDKVTVPGTSYLDVTGGATASMLDVAKGGTLHVYSALVDIDDATKVDGSAELGNGLQTGSLSVGGNLVVSAGAVDCDTTMVVSGTADIKAGVNTNSLSVSADATLDVRSGAVTVATETEIVGELDLWDTVSVSTNTCVVSGNVIARGGKLAATNAMTISGTLEHALTSNKDRAIDLNVGGKLWVRGTGKITATGKSSVASDGYWASHGGAAFSGKSRSLNSGDIACTTSSCTNSYTFSLGSSNVAAVQLSVQQSGDVEQTYERLTLRVGSYTVTCNQNSNSNWASPSNCQNIDLLN